MDCLRLRGAGSPDIRLSTRAATVGRFKWLRADLYSRVPLESELLRSDSNALLDILQAYGELGPRITDAKLDALNSLLTETFPDQKVLVFSQFADTV